MPVAARLSEQAQAGTGIKLRTPTLNIALTGWMRSTMPRKMAPERQRPAVPQTKARPIRTRTRRLATSCSPARRSVRYSCRQPISCAPIQRFETRTLSVPARRSRFNWPRLMEGCPGCTSCNRATRSARSQNTTAAAFTALPWPNISDPDRIRVGDRLWIAGAGAGAGGHVQPARHVDPA